MKNETELNGDCQTALGGSAFFSVAALKKTTKLTFLEKICLWFIKPKYQVDEFESNTLKYKIFRGKMYVLGHWINPPKDWNCRCEVVLRRNR